MADDVSNKYNPYNPYTSDWYRWEKEYGTRNEEDEKTTRYNANKSAGYVNPFPMYDEHGEISEEWMKWERYNTDKTNTKPSPDISLADYWKMNEESWNKAHTVVDVTETPQTGPINQNPQGIEIQGAPSHNIGRANTQTPSKNVYQKYQDALNVLRDLSDQNKEWAGLGGSKQIYEAMKNAWAGQKAAGQWKINQPERRPYEGVSGIAGDMKYSGLSQGQAARLEAQVGLQGAQTAPATVARQTMFDALQARIDNQLKLQGAQSDQTRTMRLKQMILEKQAQQLDLKTKYEALDTQYMNSMISIFGQTFANALSTWDQYNQKKQYGQDWAQSAAYNTGSYINSRNWDKNYQYVE